MDHPFSLLTLVLFVCSLITLATASLGGNETDLAALLAIKDKISHDPLKFMSSWNHSIHFCQWQGVTCSRRHQRVIKLELQSRQLEGSISPQVGNLSFLIVLNLSSNSLSHEIPQAIGRLFRLQQWSLEYNSFEGEIPTNISRCSNLLHLDLGANKLVGGIPAELGSLTRLQVLVIFKNKLTGGIPPSLGNLSSLQMLSTTTNFLEGGIPNSLSQLKNLNYFSLGANNLSGTIPPSMFNLSSITLFSVPQNKFHGSIPLDIGFTLPNLKRLNIHTNQFNGPFPTSIVNASNLMDIQMNYNQFTGKVPSLSSLYNLIRVVLGNNNLGNGEDEDLNFLSSLTNCTSLEVFSVQESNLGGVLPESLSNFSTNLQIMGLGTNQIRGSIPTDIGNLIGLEALGIERNQLSGAIPTSIGKLQKLNDLYLNGNNLTGNIPSSLGNLTWLGRMNLRRNILEGSIPSTLGECKNLLSLALSENNLSGPIPKEVVSLSSLSIAFVLFQNHLTGSLPLEVGKLTSLGYLDVSGNKLSGQIPSSLGSCTSLEILYMEGNIFEGPIPQSLSSLRGLQEMDLSNNNLSGQIPRYLESFYFLNMLNLSYNNFEGEVPLQGVFRNATAMSMIGNERLCGGILELKLPICIAKETTNTVKLSLGHKLVISIVSGLLGLTLALIFLYFLRKKKRVPSSKSYFNDFHLMLSYGRLHKATDGFSLANLIGEGSFGSVYKGNLEEDNMVVAVKVLHLQRRGACKSFAAECEALRNIRHRNLVKILTACSSIDFQGNDFKALVYEFMSNGNLEKWLHPSSSTGGEEHEEPRNLSMHQRLSIAIDVACALDYLHHGCIPPIVHCDVKPSNVLLDDDMIAHVGDFGLARILLDNKDPPLGNQTRSLGLKGSIGYIAPEHGMGSEVSNYVDVYSYGIMLLEIFTGKRPTNNMFKDDIDLHNMVKQALPDRATEVADSKIFLIENEEQESTTVSHNVSQERSDTIHERSMIITHNEEQERGHPIQEDSSTVTQNESQERNLVIQESLISILGIGVACSVKSPKERMDINNVVVELQRLQNKLFENGIR